MLQKYDKTMTSCHMTLPVAGLGTVKFGRNQDVKYPKPFDLPSDEAIKNLLSLAHELGVRLLDTAPAYGNSECRLGKLLPASNDWIISTKIGESFVNGVSAFDFSAKGIEKSLQQSLKNLNREQLDIVLIHSDGNDEHILKQTDAVETLQTLKQKGYIRAIGLSGKTANGGNTALRECDMDIAMITHNPIYTEEQSVIETAAQLNKHIFVKKAFASGALTESSSNPIEAAMNHLFVNHHANLSAILGTINPAHLQQNCEAIANAINTCNPSGSNTHA